MSRQKSFTIKGAGLALALFLAAPTLLHAEAVMLERPVGGGVQKGEIVGDQLFLFDRAGKRALASDGRYRGADGRMFVIDGGKIAQQPGVNAQKAGVMPAGPREGSGFSSPTDMPGQLKQGLSPHMQGQ